MKTSSESAKSSFFSGHSQLKNSLTNRPQEEICAKLKNDVSQIESQTCGLLEGIDDDNQNWSPDEGSWSIAECLIHLYLTGQSYTPLLRQAILTSKRKGLKPEVPIDAGFFGGWFIYLMQPPPKVKLNTPKRFKPENTHRVMNIKEEFTLLHKEFTMLLEDAKEICMQRTIITSPISRWLKFTFAEAMIFLLAHERRHLWQLEGIRSDEKFPQKP